MEDEMFNEIKRCCRAVWSTFDDEFGYASSKITEVDRTGNVGDNWEHLIAMFDQHNKFKLAALLEPSTVGFIILTYPRAFQLY